MSTLGSRYLVWRHECEEGARTQVGDADIIIADEATEHAKIRAFRALLGADHEYAAFAGVWARKKSLDSPIRGADTIRDTVV